MNWWELIQEPLQGVKFGCPVIPERSINSNNSHCSVEDVVEELFIGYYVRIGGGKNG